MRSEGDVVCMWNCGKGLDVALFMCVFVKAGGKDTAHPGAFFLKASYPAI